MSRPAMQLYTVFHLNLAYSSIEEEQRPQVIETCYWPVLRLAEELGLPFGIETPGYTLETIEHFTKAHEYCADDPAILLNLAKSQRNAGQPQNALESIRKALALAPSHVNYAHQHFLILRDCRRLDEAAKVLESFPESASDLRDIESARLALHRAGLARDVDEQQDWLRTAR